MTATAPARLSGYSGPVTGVLNNRSWQAELSPFHHFYVRDVFTPDIYAGLEAQFRSILARGLATKPDGRRFAPIPRYDAYAYPFTRDLHGPLSLFTSRAWHDLIAGIYGLNATGDVRGSLHHHRAGSANGGVHNDFNPAWFGGTPSPDQVILSDPAVCDYHRGQAQKPGVVPRPTVRAIAVLFYLCNQPWRPGDGGETGLFHASSGPVSTPDGVAPPHNNALLAFECTPTSWHTFLSNHLHPRNSVILWLHRPYQEAVQRWGEAQIVKW